MNPESAPLPQQPPVPQQSPDPLPMAAATPSQDQGTVVSTGPSSKKPLLIVFIIILLLGVGFYYYFVIMQGSGLSGTKPVSQNVQPVVSVVPSPTPTVNLDSSDTQLDRDIQSINNKANNLATDVINVDSGLNDVPLDNGQ